jgi:transposase-like protein
MVAAEPKTLIEAVAYFTKPENCLNYLVARRWPNGVVCPTCGSTNIGFIASRQMFQCKTRHPKAQFSVKLGTIFEDSPLGLDKWLPAMWMIASNRNGISSWELHRALGVTQKTAWFMLHRIRLAMQDDQNGGKLSGEVEVDETYIGGAARNMHPERKKRALEGKGGGSSHKTGVQGILERGGKIRVEVIPDAKYVTLVPNVQKHVESGSTVITDEWQAYRGLCANYTHETINHLESYVNGNVHTNGIENFWSLLKRGLNGTYVSVEPCSAISMSRRSASIIGFRWMTRIASATSCARLLASASPMPNSLARPAKNVSSAKEHLKRGPKKA